MGRNLTARNSSEGSASGTGIGSRGVDVESRVDNDEELGQHALVAVGVVLTVLVLDGWVATLVLTAALNRTTQRTVNVRAMPRVNLSVER